MWRELSFVEKWNLVTGTMHAAASLGLAVVAVVGLYKVAPIIVYQLEQQQQQQEAQDAPPSVEERAAAQDAASQGFINEALEWWSRQVDAHQRILDLLATQTDVATDLQPSQPVPGAPEIRSDSLIVTATLDSGRTESLRIPVNEHAPSPNQYVQYKINHGAFASLSAAERQAVEGAIASYMYNFMVPKAPPAFVERDMPREQLRQAIADGQPQRREALKHLRALQSVIDVGLEACRQ